MKVEFIDECDIKELSKCLDKLISTDKYESVEITLPEGYNFLIGVDRLLYK